MVNGDKLSMVDEEDGNTDFTNIDCRFGWKVENPAGHGNAGDV